MRPAVLAAAAAALVTALTPPAGRRALAADPPPATLAGALGDVAWNPSRQGVLLTVDPKKARLDRKATPPAIPTAAQGPAALRSLAARYGRIVVTSGSVTALAPSGMTVLNPNPAPPHLADAHPTDRLRRFLSTLDDAQWRLVTAESGIGFGDLSREQRPLWDVLLPGNARLVPFERGAAERTWTPETRRGVRLRLNRETELKLAAVSGEGRRGFDLYQLGWLGIGGRAKFWLTEHDDDKKLDPPANPLSAAVPNRPKPGHLDFADTTLDAPVSLAGAATLGDLVQRAGRAAGLELHADKRVAALPVVFRGDRARAGDLLKALCRCVTGTFRRVGPTFVLTDDLAGIAARYAVLWEWERDGSILGAQGSRVQDARIAASGAAAQIGFAPDDPLALTPDLVNAVADKHPKDAAGRDHDAPLGALPPAFQEAVSAVARHQEGENHPVRTDTVALRMTLRLTLIVPGVGEVLGHPINPDETLNGALVPRDEAPASAPPSPGDAASPRPRPAPLAKDGRTRALAVAAQDTDEASQAVALAKRFGFSELWLHAPDAAAAEVLAAAVAAGKDAGVPVVGVVRLLKTSAAAGPAAAPSPDDTRDRNVLGETSGALARRRARSPFAENGYARGALEHLVAPPGDWLRFDTPEHAAAASKRALAAAAVPGLAALALTDTAAPGYTAPGHDEWYSGLGESGSFGNATPLRLAFLRREGHDPVDLSVGGWGQISPQVALPFFPDKGMPLGVVSPGGPARPETPVQRWRAFRNAENVRFLVELFPRLRAVNAALPLLMAERSGLAMNGVRYWGSWDRAAALPAYARDADGGERGPSALARARKVSRRVLRNVALTPDARGEDWASGFDVEDPKDRYDGFVVDLSRPPLARAAAFLAAAVSPVAD